MPSYTPSQKSAIQQFTGFTQAKDSAAVKLLKTHNWNLEQAVDAYFQSNNNASSNPSAANHNLTKLFDSYRGSLIPQAKPFLPKKLTSVPKDNATSEPDTIGVQGCMRYFSDLGLSLEDPVVLVILSELAAPTMGELTRQGFLDGWKKLR
ncbi:MAG: hypothetical protein Q9222_005297, partial [Ikaeria aurantiellina]